jgi:glycosyltransferase involved in cell wall biosynthesis
MKHPREAGAVVAHVTTAHPATDNRIFRKECRALTQAGLRVTLVAVADHDHEDDGVEIIALPRRRTRITRMLIGPVDAWLALRRLRPAMIHVHDPELVPLAVAWHLLTRRPAVYDAHEDLPKQVAGKQYLPRRLRGAVAGLAHALEALADYGLSGVVVATPAIGKKYRHARVTLVQNFPWLTDFPEPTAPDASSTTFAYIGGIAEGRGALKMLEAVASSTQGAKLVLAGPISTASLASQIEARPSDVDYLGVISAERIPEVLASSCAGLAVLNPLPNYLESQSTKIYEYMAAGRPFIASNFPSWERQIGEFGCGLFVDPLSSEAIREAIDLILSDTELAREMGERGRKALVDNFIFEGEASRLIATTRTLLQI